MTFKDFKKKNGFKTVKCKCCAFCKFYEPDSYDFGGKCCHPDLDSGDEFWTNTSDFNICDKFEDRK